ncbi:uncharacterized protein K452DRAFT_238736, partial [Aplosporella prunicola CBS 121167]
EEIVSPTELLDLVDSLPALNPMELLGEWSAGSFNTRHPAHGWLRSINWVGITFRSVDDVEPIVVAAQTRDGPGKGHRRKWLDEWGNAEVIEAKYRGVVSAAMVCDNHPVVNHFRKVTDNVVLGIMSAKMYRHAGLFFFYLTRL